MKKLTAFLFSIVLMMGLLSGCGSNDATTEQAPAEPSSQIQTEAQNNNSGKTSTNENTSANEDWDDDVWSEEETSHSTESTEETIPTEPTEPSIDPTEPTEPTESIVDPEKETYEEIFEFE